MTVFSGLCVGGPLAGRRMDAAQPSIRAPVLPGEPIYLGDAVEPTDSTAEHVLYVHEEISIGREGARFGFWRVHDWTLYTLLSELALAYEEKQTNAR